jgi:ubiquinone/menaquinone biosynthesis C-methylase UbiE
MSEHVCPWWLAWTFDNPLRRLIHPPLRILQPYIQPGDVAADIGAGMGYFTLALAQLVGPTGSVFAIDLQQAMLQRAQQRAARHKLSARISFRQCTSTRLGLDEVMDFVLAFWMVHEVSDQAEFFAEIVAALKPKASFLVVEPRGHVSGTAFEDILKTAAAAGLFVQSWPKIALSRAAVLQVFEQ